MKNRIFGFICAIFSIALIDACNGGENTSLSPETSESVYTVGGTVAGLVGTVVLVNNDGDDLSVDKDGSFAFKTPLNPGVEYNVTVKTQPQNPR